MTLDYLKWYLEMGWKIFPCSRMNKKPIPAHSFTDASNDLKQIEKWFLQETACAWGLQTSAEVGVIDIDLKHGGIETLAELEKQYGKLPRTPMVRTGGGGFHYYFRFPANTNCWIGMAQGIDRKAVGGYVIIPPSIITLPEHEGRAYAWEIKPWGTPIAEAPTWCAQVNSKGKGKATNKQSQEASNPWVVQEAGEDLLSHSGSAEGERNATLCKLVGIHIARRDDEEQIYELAEAWAEKCSPPFEEWEKAVTGLMEKENAKAKARSVKITSEDHSDSLELVPSPSLLPQTARASDREPSELVPSLPSNGGANRQQGGTELVPSLPAFGEAETTLVAGGRGVLLTPLLSAEAYQGLLGEMLKSISPETEAHPAGILLGWLTCLGNIVGRGAWFAHEASSHHPALFVGIVGRTSDAKGVSFSHSLYPFKQIEPVWAKTCIANGVGSGEGLIELIADTRQQLNKKSGIVELIQGASDKRCLLRLSELSKAFKLGRRENATLSEYLREAWDGELISVPNRSSNALATSDYAVSLIGDITPRMLEKLLSNGTEAFDGFANRFLWCCVQSGKDLPNGGNIKVLSPFLDRLAEALAFAKTAGEMQRDEDANKLWENAYAELRRSGDSVPHTERGRPYVLRLSMLYALADGSKVIRLEHLQASLAVWDYCRASASLLFADASQQSPDPLWLRLQNAIIAKSGISRAEMREIVGHKVSAEDIETALAYLERSKLAFRRMRKPDGGGRPAECWYPCEGPSKEVYNPHSPLHPTTSTNTVPASAGTGREGTNSPSEDCLPDQNSGREQTNSAVAVPETMKHSGEETLGRELTPLQAVPPATGELVCSLPATEQTDEAEKEKTKVLGQGESGVVNSTAQTFHHEANGTIGITGQPKPDRYPTAGASCHRVGTDLVTTLHFDAGDPPLVKPVQLADESDSDYFLRRLDFP